MLYHAMSMNINHNLPTTHHNTHHNSLLLSDKQLPNQPLSTHTNPHHISPMNNNMIPMNPHNNPASLQHHPHNPIQQQGSIPPLQGQHNAANNTTPLPLQGTALPTNTGTTPGATGAATNMGDPNLAGMGVIDDESDEYTHGYQPLDPRELTDAERLFMDYGTEGHLDAMIDLYNKCKIRRQEMKAKKDVQHNLSSTTSSTTSTIQLQTATNKSLSSLEIEIDCQDLWGSTPLMHASVKKHIDVMKWLITHGADINKQDYRGITVLMENCWNCKIDMVKMLLQGKLGNTAPIDINLQDERDYTALMQAAEEGHAGVVQLLIEYKADLNKQEKKRNYTSLMWSVVEGHPGVVQLLVNAGADLNVQDKYGFTALMQAARTRFLAAVLLLVGNGADLDVKDKKGRNVYDLGNQQVLQAIEKGKRELRRRYMQILSTDRQISQWQPEILQTICTYLTNA